MAPSIDALEQAWSEFATDAIPRSLSISAPPSFVDHWLAARMEDFACEGTPVELEGSQAFIAPSWIGDRIDLAVRYGVAPWPGVAYRTLITDRVLPVGAADLRCPNAPAWRPSALAGRRLFEVAWPARQARDRRPAPPGWRDWLAAYAREVRPAPVICPGSSTYEAALSAAADCDGLVLASKTVTADRLAAGTLCAPFGRDADLSTPFEFALVTPDDQGAAPPVAARFMAWLTEAAERFSQHADD